MPMLPKPYRSYIVSLVYNTPRAHWCVFRHNKDARPPLCPPHPKTTHGALLSFIINAEEKTYDALRVHWCVLDRLDRGTRPRSVHPTANMQNKNRLGNTGLE